MSAPLLQLRQVCSIEKGGLNPQAYAEECFAHYSIPAFDDGSKPVIEHGLQIKSQKTAISRGTVLVSKLNPRIPRVWYVADEQPFRRICSTEFVPFKPDTSRLSPEYLAFALRQLLTGGQITGSTSAATKSRERAKPSDIAALLIPVPALDEQQHIVDLLSRAEGIVRLRRQAQQKVAALIPAIFIDMFGDPATNPKGWPRMALGDLIASGPTNGLYKHKSAYGSGTPILRIDAFYDGRVTDLAALKRVQVGPDQQRRFALAAGDIIVNRVNSPEYLGKSALVPELLEPTVFESNMMRFSIDGLHALPEFVIALLQDPSSRRHFLTNAKHAINQSSINQQDLKSLPVFLPPLQLQRRFAQRVAAVLAIEQQQQAATAMAEATFSALLAKAFAVEAPQQQRSAERALAWSPTTSPSCARPGL